MPRLIEKPILIQAAGQPSKRIEEYIGQVCTGTETVSIARMKSPAGWMEPGQTPEFDEYTIILKGTLQVQSARSENKDSCGPGDCCRERRMGSIQHSG